MFTNFFKKIGWFYLPVSVPGCILALVYLAVNVQLFLAIDRHAHSVSDTLIGFFPYFISLSVFYWWIASHTSQPQSGEQPTANPSDRVIRAGSQQPTA